VSGTASDLVKSTILPIVTLVLVTTSANLIGVTAPAAQADSRTAVCYFRAHIALIACHSASAKGASPVAGRASLHAETHSMDAWRTNPLSRQTDRLVVAMLLPGIIARRPSRCSIKAKNRLRPSARRPAFVRNSIAAESAAREYARFIRPLTPAAAPLLGRQDQSNPTGSLNPSRVSINAVNRDARRGPVRGR